MKIEQLLIVVLPVLLIIACNNHQQQNVVTQAKVDTVAADADTSKYTQAMVDNKKDLACGMPLTAGIGDTAHYKGKVFGFCSTECKNEFLKNPKKYLAKNK